MNVTSVFESMSQGLRPEMQDVIYTGCGQDGTQYMAIFDGHGNNGLDIAQLASNTVRETVERGGLSGNVLNHARLLRVVFHTLHKRILDDDMAKASGTTATVAIIQEDEIAGVYLGDSQAVFYPDDELPIALVESHNTSNVDEVARVGRRGIPVVGGYFGGTIAVSRAIGDTKYTFMSQEAKIKKINLAVPGILVVASDGVWGPKRENREAVDDVVRSTSNPRDLPGALLKANADIVTDNASAIVARIE